MRAATDNKSRDSTRACQRFRIGANLRASCPFHLLIDRFFDAFEGNHVLRMKDGEEPMPIRIKNAHNADHHLWYVASGVQLVNGDFEAIW